MSVDLQRMIDTAVAYFLAGERLTPRFSFGVYGEHTVIAPAIANYALATEIGLKILLAHHNSAEEFQKFIKKMRHDLFELFCSLPDTTQKKMLHEKKWFEKNRKTFVDWRYPYEAEYLGVVREPLRRSFIIVHKCIREEIPSLISTYEHKFGKFEPDGQWAWYEQELKEHNEICARQDGKKTDFAALLKKKSP